MYLYSSSWAPNTSTSTIVQAHRAVRIIVDVLVFGAEELDRVKSGGSPGLCSWRDQALVHRIPTPAPQQDRQMQEIAQDADDHRRLRPGDHAGDDGIILLAGQLLQPARYVIEAGHRVSLGDLNAHCAQGVCCFPAAPGNHLQRVTA